MAQNKTPRPRQSGGQKLPSGPTEEPPRELVEAAEFLVRMKGTLPEQITAADLETINTGLRFFFSKLRLASGLFRQSGDDSRHGAIVALDAAWRLVALFKQPYAECLHLPALHLRDALRQLDEGSVPRMLIKSVRRPGRSRSSDPRAALKGRAAGTVAQLVNAGMSRPDAYAQVAEALGKLGVRRERGVRRRRDSEEIASSEITARTVRLWCEEVDADVGRHGVAAFVYDDMFTDDERQKFSSLPSDRARLEHALNSLAAFVQAHFPSIQKPRSSETGKPT